MRGAAWALAGCMLLLAPSLALAESPTAYPTRVVAHQTSEAKRLVGDPASTATGAAATAQAFVQSLDPGPVVAGAEAKANATAGPALGDALAQLGPIGDDVGSLAGGAAGTALDKATHAPDIVQDEHDYVNRVIRHWLP
ncbi:MAG: hypothetical protein LC624_01325 [Halobacteriales archaeon]|nr:hypothetical protein [Halobacteriales archaeon]